MRRFAVLAVGLALAFGGCGGEDKKATTTPARLDQSTPRALTQSLFAIAKQGNLAALAGVAAPEVAAREAKDLAELAGAPAEDQQTFKTDFATGTITGERIHGEKAEVDIRYGPDGKKAERLVLVKVGEKWFLQSL